MSDTDTKAFRLAELAPRLVAEADAGALLDAARAVLRGAGDADVFARAPALDGRADDTLSRGLAGRALARRARGARTERGRGLYGLARRARTVRLKFQKGEEVGRHEIVSLIIDSCLKRHGEGQVFYRGDGLAFEARRVARRAAYLEEHPETKPEYRELIEKGAITPGMSRGESIAAWGLIDEDMSEVGGRSTADNHHGYSYYYGFNLDRPYVLYLIDNTVVGVEEDTKLTFHGTAWRERQLKREGRD
jgi:hypothetical protein